ncbi:hypothetical protein SAMN05661008_00349 [Alkalithermobacter thermoalcaliphilus JW-YL-7 = DSM 7308]|uniref:Uncharacterized protein n=1 Tax=Alkalithermobacter thermoalcaliphilus JW-YL-7 = DSM 7308 TaxID=1121328 RepID=A0A150FPA1_CLOPD|nr:hypothetical protein JWYL7_0539 [[Clostridium] paradoxum JW-YL-7 = DSM 7308]SHK50630.1 hypothetical protein SAMN05661008_00349 [[Clostridium] paradoxum JW-YL-7 = DSM 7308]
MRIIDNIQYYTTTDVAKEVGKSQQTIWLWDKYSNELEARNEPRLIPVPLWHNNSRYYTAEQVEEIKEFSNNIKRGDLARFNREKWGKRGKEIKKRMAEKNKIKDVDKWRQENRFKMLKEGLI